MNVTITFEGRVYRAWEISESRELMAAVGDCPQVRYTNLPDGNLLWERQLTQQREAA